MNAFLYFLPLRRGVPTPESLKRDGLGYAFPHGKTTHTAELEGPNGQFGAVVSAGDRLQVKRDAQVWLEMTGLDRQSDKPAPWVGIWKAPGLRPGPEDLRRSGDLCDGHLVTLGDENAWQIPIVRGPLGHTALPRVLRPGPDGKPTETVRHEYSEVVRLTERLWDLVLDAWSHDRKPDPTARFILDLASEALAVNYRVRRWEVSLLELVDTANIREIADAVVDGPAIKRWLDSQKSGQDGARNP